MVQQLLFGLDRFVKAGSLDPGRPETAPGADGPRRAPADGYVRVPPPDGSPALRKAAADEHERRLLPARGRSEDLLVGVETYDAFIKAGAAVPREALARYAPIR